MADELYVFGREPVARRRPPRSYTPAERLFSRFVQERMIRLLRGDEDSMLLMRHYGHDAAEISFFVPSRLRQREMRPEVAEEIIHGVIRFLNPYAPGGPVSQEHVGGELVETQIHPTHYPHIVLQRVDRFNDRNGECLVSEFSAVRLQNQRRSVLVNRALDVSNLALELSRLLPVV